MKMYTELDLRLGHVQLTAEQVRILDERVMPILTRAAKRAFPKILAEQAAAQLPKASGDR